MVPTKKVDKTPYEIWHGKEPNLSYLKVWGCEAYVKRDSADKLQQRSVKCAMDEEMKSMKVNKVWIVIDRPPNAKVVRNRWLYKKKTDMDGKDLGEAAYILGIKIYRDRSLRLFRLNQSAYIDKILKKFNMRNSKKGFIPMEVKHDLSNEMCASSDEEKAYMKKVPYASAVGSIMYAVRCTRPDVAFSQNLVSRYQQNPRKLHWVAVKHILKYPRNTKDMFLVYGGNPDT
nr:retrotransposon protein, putative, Ty1-copia subclass [Tanacetum cinerariifolium]